MASNRYIAVCLLTSLGLLQGCSEEQAKSFSDLKLLKEALIKEFKVEDVTVAIRDMKVVSVSFVNSPSNKLSQLEKEAKAREVALFVKDHYASIGSIKALQVAFVVHET